MWLTCYPICLLPWKCSKFKNDILHTYAFFGVHFYMWISNGSKIFHMLSHMILPKWKPVFFLKGSLCCNKILKSSRSANADSLSAMSIVERAFLYIHSLLMYKSTPNSQRAKDCCYGNWLSEHPTMRHHTEGSLSPICDRTHVPVPHGLRVFPGDRGHGAHRFV